MGKWRFSFALQEITGGFRATHNPFILSALFHLFCNPPGPTTAYAQLQPSSMGTVQ